MSKPILQQCYSYTDSKHGPVRNRVLRICVLNVSLSNTSYSKVFKPIISGKLRLEPPVSLFQDLGILTFRYLYASKLLNVFIEEVVTDILKQIHTTYLYDLYDNDVPTLKSNSKTFKIYFSYVAPNILNNLSK